MKSQIADEGFVPGGRLNLLSLRDPRTPSDLFPAPPQATRQFL